MTRQLDTVTLDEAARFRAGQFLLPSYFSVRTPSIAIAGRDWVLQSFYNATFKDEFDYMLAQCKTYLGPATLADFEAEIKKFEPRDDKVFESMLAEKLAINPLGNHIEGQIGTVKIGGRRVGTHVIEVEAPDSIARRRRLGIPKDAPGQRALIQKIVHLDWPIYAGEGDERIRGGGGVADPLPVGTEPLPLGALNTRISNAAAQAGANPLVDILDDGSAGATIQGRDGAQPADPDTVVSGTNGFTLTCSVTAFGAATDAAPGALKTAAAITDDTAADATITLSYCRASSSNVADTPLTDHIDGEAGTSGADFNFNTLAIVSGATVSMTSWTITLPEA